MKDRVVQYPSRYQLVQVAGTTDTYDLVPVPGTVTEEGTPLNKASLLKDTTAALVGLGTSALPDEALRAAALKTKGKLIQSYTVAGTYTWTAPDLNDGADYEVGVLIIGGGGSGGATKVCGGSTLSRFAIGGGSGYARAIKLIVSPGDEFPIVIGFGGASAITAATSVNNATGNNGGSSSFNGIVALGGNAGYALDSAITYGANGGQASDCTDAAQQGQFYSRPHVPDKGITPLNYSTGLYAPISYPTMSINPFTGGNILAAGGAIQCRNIADWSGRVQVATEIYDDGGIGGASKVTYNATSDQSCVNPTSVGCGGGAIGFSGPLSNTTNIATSGKGADGGVFIYV